MKIAILGLGAMGSRMAARAVAAGHEVVSWNRSPRRVEGAVPAESPRVAATSAELVLSMLTGDEASREVWLRPESGALAGLRPGALAVAMSTVSPGWAVALSGAVTEAGGRFIAAPVIGTLPHAEAGILGILAGGEAEDVADAEPGLACMGAVKHVGDPRAALTLKLAINGLFASEVALLVEALRLLETADIGRDTGLELLEKTPVFAPILSGIAGLMRAGDEAPRFPVNLVVKDLSYATSQAELPIMGAARSRYKTASDSGFGGLNIHAVGRLYDRGR